MRAQLWRGSVFFLLMLTASLASLAQVDTARLQGTVILCQHFARACRPFTIKHLREDEVQVSLLWLALGLAVVTAIGRGFWLYRASLTWPTADGVITRLDVDR
jgi:hypothetical protein